MVAREEVDGADRIRDAMERGIRFVQLQFTDILGVVKAVTIPIHQLEGSVLHGTWFDGSSIEGFTRIAESDQYLMPDMDTFREIPWQAGSGPRGTGSVICDVYTPRGEPQALHNAGRLAWGSGPRGEKPDYTGLDVIIVRGDKIAALYVFLDSMPS